MSNRFEFPTVERFVIGTVGVPGERAFFLQIRGGGRVASFALEKNQAAALSDRAIELMREAGVFSGESLMDLDPLESPIESEFTVGEMSWTWLTESDQVRFEAESIEGGDSDSGPDLIAMISLPILRGFVKRTPQVVSAGRQPCIFCGGPIDPNGHLCPRANGHLRRA
jgi:uncharacterized repeat protein (TIGR03847 family)